MNFIAIGIAALVPSIIGFIYYNPKVVGNVWMKEAHLTDKDIQGSNMILIMGLSLLFSFLLAFSLQFMVIHQIHLESIAMNKLSVKGSPDFNEATALIANFNAKYGNEFRTFKHGAFHGLISSILLVLPIVGMNSLYERKSFKYIFIHVGFWAICLSIMGGILSAMK